jgi:RNA polymerase sigma factor (sigma-70 family)
MEVSMEDEFLTWLASQRVTLQQIKVTVLKMANDELAKDALSEVLIELDKTRRSGCKVADEPARFFSFVRTVATHALGRLRKKSRLETEAVDAAFAAVVTDPASPLERQEFWDVVHSTLNGVKHRDVDVFQVIRLIFKESLAQKEVAERFGVAEVTIHRAKRKAFVLLERKRPDLMGEI